MIERAYDIAILPAPADRASPDNHGWVFGLPPGIRPEQWPLDPVTGYPLMHGFTLLLPEDYRCHGPEIVAVSFFATAADQNDGGARAEKDMMAAVLGDAMPVDARFRPFWRPSEARHPHLHRMTDILNYHYAVILLTQAEFDGPFCSPPVMPRDAIPMDSAQKKLGGSEDEDGNVDWVYGPVCSPPDWLAKGGARAAFEGQGGGQGGDDAWAESLMGRPEPGLAVNRALRRTPRIGDPNAGKPPREDWAADFVASGYQPPAYFEGDVIDAAHWREHDWAKNRPPIHIGGTMRPVQNIPDVSPYYIEFEEWFGGYNFGAGGNAQLDFKDMKFDWACG